MAADLTALAETPSITDAVRAALADARFDPVRAAVAQSERAPKTPAAWFEFCENYSWPVDPEFVRDLKARARVAPVEFFIGLNALLEALRRAPSLHLPLSLRRQFEIMCREWAEQSAHWADQFDVDSPRFFDVMRLASLNRFIAGEVAFEFGSRLPHDFMFRCHPLHLPSLLRQIYGPMHGAAPVLGLNFNYARRNRLVVSQAEFERALWRLAKLVEAWPELNGIVSNAWFHSLSVRETFPRLAWMRDIFLAGGAFAIDLEPGHADDIAYNSGKRRELYDAGKFSPRHTLILWPRDSLLAWAASRTDLADPEEAPITAPARVRHSVASPKPRPSVRANSPLHLWDGVEGRKRYGAKYWAMLLGAPSVLAGLLGFWFFGWLWGALDFGLTTVAMLMLQYYVSQ